MLLHIPCSTNNQTSLISQASSSQSTIDETFWCYKSLHGKYLVGGPAILQLPTSSSSLPPCSPSVSRSYSVWLMWPWGSCSWVVCKLVCLPCDLWSTRNEKVGKWSGRLTKYNVTFAVALAILHVCGHGATSAPPGFLMPLRVLTEGRHRKFNVLFTQPMDSSLHSWCSTSTQWKILRWINW